MKYVGYPSHVETRINKYKW